LFIHIRVKQVDTSQLNTTRAVQPVATCRQSPYLHKPALVIVTSFSLWRLAPIAALASSFPLWRHCHYNILRLRRSQPPFSLWRHSHCASFSTKMATPIVTDVRTYGHLTAFNI